MPTRGRLEGLRRVFDNFQATVADKARFELWIYVDDDDTVTLEYLAEGAWRGYDFPIHWHVGACKNSMGEMVNELWQCSTTNAGIYFPFMDDYIVTTAGWDEVVRRCFRDSPHGFTLGYVRDPTAQPHQVTITIASARWLNSLGYFVTERFYHWFGDSWLDQIAQMVDCKVLVPIGVHPPQGKGKTLRMRNLPFWCGYFHKTLRERYEQALEILSLMHPEQSHELQAARQRAMRVAATLQHQSYASSLADLQRDEQKFRDFSRIPRPGQLAGYLICEARAVEDLLELLKQAADQGAAADQTELIDTLKLASFQVPDLHLLEAAALMQLGFREDGLASVEREIELHPEEPKGLILKQELMAGEGRYSGSYRESRSVLRMPSWVELPEPTSLLLPEQIDLELFYTLQAFIYQDNSVKNILDIGAGTGEGSSRALIETGSHREDLRVFCIEPDPTKFAALAGRYAGRASLFNAASVDASHYLTQRELELYYHHVLSILNVHPLEMYLEQRQKELDDLKQRRTSTDGILRAKQEAGIEHFDLALLDGSLFCGPADLAGVYGAKYLALSYVGSVKNHANFKTLTEDARYQLVAGNLQSGCGYAVFARR
jgi:hypothetical protein